MKYGDSKFKNWIISLLRRGTYMWKPRNEAQRDAQVAPATFKCAICNNWIYTGTKELEKTYIKVPSGIKLIKGVIKVDHIDPVVPIEGFTNFDDYIRRMFCIKEGFQVLCDECHDKKTIQEKGMRTEHRKKNT
jgi:hypothetical protein